MNLNRSLKDFLNLLIQLRRLEMDFKINQQEIKYLMELGYDKWQERYDNIINQPHNNENFWLLKNCTRQQAEDLLAEAPTGTFLIRPRSAGHYALSISCRDVVNHCIIYETETGYYGFAEPYNIYQSLNKLVEHYSSNSLEEHNDTLTTTLRIPVFYWHQNKEIILQQLQDEKLESDMMERQLALELQQQQHQHSDSSDLLIMPPPPPPPPQQSAMPTTYVSGIATILPANSLLMSDECDSSSSSSLGQSLLPADAEQQQQIIPPHKAATTTTIAATTYPFAAGQQQQQQQQNQQ